MNKLLGTFFLFMIALLFFLQEKGEHKQTVIHKIDAKQIKEVPESNDQYKFQDMENSIVEQTSSDSTLDEPSDIEWEETVKENLIRQAYDDSMEVNFKKEQSFVWNELGTPIEVNSLKVNLRNPAGESISFRAMVDSKTGKILRTWDRPVFDPANPRERRGIKVNPLYHPEDQ